MPQPHIILLALAIVLLTLDALRLASSARINLAAAGLACWALSYILIALRLP